jgi:2-iminobutanoate/2-iminopropanoate deaminase
LTATESFDAGIARQIGPYADAVRIPADHDQIVVSGTPGLAPDGSLAGDIAGQATQAWRNVETALNMAGAQLRDIVSVRQWLTSAEDVRTYVGVRRKFITHKPTFMLGIIPGLVRPDFLVEIEVIAAVPAAKASRNREG